MLCVRIDRNTPETCVRLKNWDCSSRLVSTEEVYAHVSRKFCPAPDTKRRKFDGCEWKEEIIPAAAPPTIKYPAFEIDDDGRVCFLWDHLLFDQKDGRYVVDIFVCDEKKSTIELQLESRLRATNPKNVSKECGHGCYIA